MSAGVMREAALGSAWEAAAGILPTKSVFAPMGSAGASRRAAYGRTPCRKARFARSRQRGRRRPSRTTPSPWFARRSLDRHRPGSRDRSAQINLATIAEEPPITPARRHVGEVEGYRHPLVGEGGRVNSSPHVPHQYTRVEVAFVEKS